MATALSVAVTMFGASLLLEPYLQQTPFALCFAGVAGASWIGGRKAGALAVAGSTLAGRYAFLDPEHQFTIDSTASAVSLLTFLLVAASLVLLIDLFQRSQATETRTARRYQQLFEQAADAVFVFRPDGRFYDVNPAAEALTGYPRAELLRRHVWELGYSENPEDTRQRFGLLLASGFWRGETEMRRADGEIIPVEVTISVIDPDAIIQTTIRDIRTRRRVEQAHQNFIATVSHELKSPLTSIRGFAQFMLQEAAVVPRGLEAIVSQSTQMERMIEDLLTATTLGAERMEMQRAPIDLVEIVQHGVRDAQVTSENHRLLVTVPDAPVIGNWDAGRLRQVLRNLLSNAIKYAPAENAIWIEVTCQDCDAVITVRDEGPGIPQREQARIFERFYRARQENEQIAGLGLGLFITKALVEAHGGTIAVTSEREVGTSFTVRLPRDP